MYYIREENKHKKNGTLLLFTKNCLVATLLGKIFFKGAIECIDTIFLIVLWYLYRRYVAYVRAKNLHKRFNMSI